MTAATSIYAPANSFKDMRARTGWRIVQMEVVGGTYIELSHIQRKPDGSTAEMSDTVPVGQEAFWLKSAKAKLTKEITGPSYEEAELARNGWFRD